MGGMSDALELSFLQTNFIDAPEVYLGLFKTVPTDVSATNEVTGGSYSRVLCNFPAATNPLISPEIVFPIPTADWGIVLGWGIFTAITGGLYRSWNELTGPLNIVTGREITFIITLAPD